MFIPKIKNKKREGGTAEAWEALFGKEKYENCVKALVGYAFEHYIEKISPDVINYVDLPLIENIDARLVFEETDGEITLISFFPFFKYAEDELQNIVFKIGEIEEWKNDVEAVFDGEIFQQAWFGFFCQNYIEYKKYEPVYMEEIFIIPTVLCFEGEIVPENERKLKIKGGKFKGQIMNINDFRGMLPNSKGQLEFCEFGFPIVDVEEINILDEKIYKIKGVLTDLRFDIPDYEYHHNYYVFAHHSNIKNSELVKKGEPFRGVGWIQAEITDQNYNIT